MKIKLPTHQTFRGTAGGVVAICEIEWHESAFSVIDPPDLPLGLYSVSLTDEQGNEMPISWDQT